jgi:hypothetical protein
MANVVDAVGISGILGEADHLAVLPEIEVKATRQIRVVSPAIFLLITANQFVVLLTRHAGWRSIDGVFFAVCLAGLLLNLASGSRKLLIFPDRFEIRTWARRRIYRYADLAGPFELFQKKFAPGFDIAFVVRGTAMRRATLGADSPLDVNAHELWNLLRLYQTRASETH